MNRVTGCLVILVLLCANVCVGQNAQPPSQYVELQQVLEKLKTEVEDIPYNIGKVANQQISYDSTRITSQGFRLIEHEIERMFSEHGRINILSLEEFDEEKVLKITGTDSTLSLRNTSRSASDKENSLRLLELSQKYGVDAFLQGNVQYRADVGYVISLELISPKTREVMWSRSLVSKDMEPEEEPSKGKLTLIQAGASVLPTNDYLINNNSYSGEILFLDYAARLAFRQPINSENSGYIGLQGGYHYYNVVPKNEEQSDYEPYTTSIFEVGAVFYKTIGEKSEQKGEHWVDLFVGPNLLISTNSKNLFSLTQGVNVNVSENLGITLDVQYLFSSTPTLENGNDATIQKTVQLNTIGYGVKVLLRL